MYDAETVLRAIDRNTALTLLLAGGALVGMTVWLAQAYRNARRDRTFALPVFCTVYWLVHDGHYAAHAHTWFTDYHHWFPQLFWVALTCTATFEVGCTYMIFRYGREEVAPTLDPRRWRVVVAGTVLAGLCAWLMVKSVIGDPLYIVTNGLAVLSFGIFGLARIARNGDLRAQSVLMWQGFTLCAVCWFAVTTIAFGDTFRTWQWLLVGVASVASGVVGTVTTSRMADRVAQERPIAATPRA